MSLSPGHAVARSLAGLRLDGPALHLSARVLRHAPGSRVASSLGWHLGQVAGPAPRVARLPSGRRMAVDVRDYAHRQIFLTGLYEEGITQLMRRLARPAWSVADVGANAGYHALLAADLGGVGTRVLAFEPSARMRGLLTRSLALDPRGGVEVVAAACGEHAGPLSFRMSEDLRNTGLSTTHEGPPASDEVEVPGVRLDEACASRDLRPDLVKIDVEGAEAAVLRGASSMLRDQPPAHVICELWPDARQEVLALMAGHGYQALGISEDGALTEQLRAGPAPWSDVCFRHASAAER